MVGQSEGKVAADRPPSAMRANLTRPSARASHAFRLLTASTLLVAASACASTAEPTPEDSHYGAVQLVFQDFRGSGQQLAILNETAVDRVDLYSKAGTPIGTKVASDEIANVLVETFESEDFWTYARPGAPPSGPRPMVNGQELMGLLHLSTGDRSGWTATYKGMSTAEAQSFSTCVKAFVVVYNDIAAFQTVDNPTGQNLFKQPKAPR